MPDDDDEKNELPDNKLFIPHDCQMKMEGETNLMDHSRIQLFKNPFCAKVDGVKGDILDYEIRGQCRTINVGNMYTINVVKSNQSFLNIMDKCYEDCKGD